MEKAKAERERGNNAFKAERYAEAAQHYTAAIAAAPEAALYSNLAACHLQLKQFHKAIEDCRKAIEMDPQPVKPYYRQAQAHAALGELKQAQDVLKLGIDRHPNEPNMLREHDSIHILIGFKDGLVKLIEEQQLSEALKKVSSLLEKCEMDYDLLVLKIQLLCKTGEPKAAQTLLSERQLLLATRSSTKHTILSAMVDRYMNKLDDAKKKLQSGARSDPDNDELKSEIKHLFAMEAEKAQGNKLFAEKKLKEAIEVYDRCLLLDPFNGMWKATLCSNKASCYMGLKETKAAYDLMKTATMFDPQSAKNWYKRGCLERDLKEWESAAESMKKAKSLDSTLNIDGDIKQISQELKKINDKNYYEVLGVSKKASQEEIKSAYKTLVRKYHPDRHQANSEEQEKAEKMFKLVNEANEVLSDPQKRQQYDDNGCRKVEDGGGFGGFHGFHGFPGGGFHGGSGGFGIDISDLFSTMFMNQGGAQFKFGRQGSQGGRGGRGGHGGGSFNHFNFQ